MTVMDCAQNYMSTYQDDVQSSHWNHEHVRLYPAVYYYQVLTVMKRTGDEIHVFSNKIHDSYATRFSKEKEKSDYMQEKCIEINRVFKFTGCAKQVSCWKLVQE